MPTLFRPDFPLWDPAHASAGRLARSLAREKHTRKFSRPAEVMRQGSEKEKKKLLKQEMKNEDTELKKEEKELGPPRLL